MHIYTADEIRVIDGRAEQEGLSTFTLMENAGHAIFQEIGKHLSHEKRILILSGKGNNGGDGIVLARLLKNEGYHVDIVFPLGLPESETARLHFSYFSRLGYQVEAEPTGRYDLIIDALLGIGAKLPLRESIKTWIAWINQTDGYKIAIDIPTGIQADNGRVDTAVFVDETLCLHGFKPSAFLQESIDYYGSVKCLNIGLPATSQWYVWGADYVKRTCFHRNENANKGSFGTGLLLAGNDSMRGCAVLSAKAALRSGIGKLTVATSPQVINTIANHLLECSYQPMDWMNAGVQEEINWAQFQAVAIGPGLDDVVDLELLVKLALDAELPLVLDAAALQARNYENRQAFVVLTPHPKEMSRLTGLSVGEIQANRLQVASAYAVKQGVAVILKGRKTVCAFPSGRVAVIETGNVALAKGGTGDALTGILLAFLSYYTDYEAAVCNAVYLHGLCADIWKEQSSTATMLASDLIEILPDAMRVAEGSK